MSEEGIIREALLKGIQRIIEEEANEAAKRVEKRVRESAGSLAATILSHFEMSSHGPKGLKIVVNFDNTKDEQCKTH